MTNETYYQYIKPFIVAFYALAIAATSGFGILFLQISTGETLLYSQFTSLAIGSGLGIVYSLTEVQNLRYREKLEEEEE